MRIIAITGEKNEEKINRFRCIQENRNRFVI